MNLPTPYLAYIKWGLIALVLIAIHGWGVTRGERIVQARFDKHLLADATKDLAAANALAQAQAARDEARQKLDEYKPKVVERVRANPSGCVLPKPVADGLRDQVRATNEAIVSAHRAVP